MNRVASIFAFLYQMTVLERNWNRWAALSWLTLVLSATLLFSCAQKPARETLSTVEKTYFGYLELYMKEQASGLAIEHFHHGRAEFARGALGLAVAHLESATKLSPEWSLPYLELARIYPFYNNDDAARLHALEKAVEFSPDNPRIHFLLATAYAEKGRFLDAELHFTRAILLKNNHPEARLRLANMLRDQGRLEEAIREYRRLIVQGHGNESIHLILATLYEKAGRLEDAEKELKFLIDSKINTAFAYMKLARFYERCGRSHEAKAMMRKAKTLKPQKKKRKMRPLLPSRR